MSSSLFGKFVGSIFFQSSLGFCLRDAILCAGFEFLLKFLDGDFVISHDLELLSKLDGLIERLPFLLYACFFFDFLSSTFDGLLKLHVAVLVCIQLHVLLCFNESRDQLTAGLAHLI